MPILYVRHSRFEIDLLRGEVVEEGMKHMLTTIAVGFQPSRRVRPRLKQLSAMYRRRGS